MECASLATNKALAVLGGKILTMTSGTIAIGIGQWRGQKKRNACSGAAAAVELSIGFEHQLQRQVAARHVCHRAEVHRVRINRERVHWFIEGVA